MDMDPHKPKAVWGFNGTERPSAVYLAAVLAAPTQKGLPAFGIYGRDVQDAGDPKIPADVVEKLLRFGRPGPESAQADGGDDPMNHEAGNLPRPAKMSRPDGKSAGTVCSGNYFL
jgi:hypothetical protein